MPSLDLWIDGSGLECHAGFRQPIDFDFDRFLEDRRYAALVSDHINYTLEHLAKELEELAIHIPRTRGEDLRVR